MPSLARQRQRSYRLRLEVLEAREMLSVYTVDRLTDTGVGVGRIGDLRYCISHAVDGDSIIFTAAGTGTIDLTSPLPNLSHNVHVRGPGAGRLIVRRSGGGGSYGIFTVDSQATVTLSGLTVINGFALDSGGGILNRGTLTLTKVIVAGNSANLRGGGVANFGTMTISKSVVTANLVVGLGSAEGGGVYNAGVLDVLASVVADNSTRVGRVQGGGGIETSGTLTINTSAVLGNSTNGSGGGIDGTGQLTITNSTVANNRAVTAGGGISVTDATVVVSNSTFAGNGLNGTDPAGGAIAVVGGTLDVRNSTIAGNAIQSAGSGSHGGGGLSLAGDAVGTVHDTIVAGNAAPLGPDVSGELTSSGYNLIGDPSDAGGFDATDLLGVDPQLGPLQNNGGATPTMAPACGSPAIDAGDPDFQGLPNTDQRGAGYSRVVNGVVDIGAYEIQDGECTGTAPGTGTAVHHVVRAETASGLVALTLAGPAHGLNPAPAPAAARAGRTGAEVAAIDRLFAAFGGSEHRSAPAPLAHRARAAAAGMLSPFGGEWLPF